MTNRTDLDEQITSTFRCCGFPNLRLTKSAQDLRDLLRTATGATIMTTIQKFQDHVDDGSDLLLNDSDDIFVLIDESHRIISANNNDHLKKYHLTKEQQKHYIERFKKPLHEDRMAFIIVLDILRTGFNAPVEQVMCLVKPLKEHYMLQVIARTNRIYDKKAYDLTIDYYGVSEFLKHWPFLTRRTSNGY